MNLKQKKMGRLKKRRYIKSISVPQDVNAFFEWIQEEGIERSSLITKHIRKSALYKIFLEKTGYERSLTDKI